MPIRSYPNDLAARVRAGWPDDAAPLPPCLEAILETAYHASFLRDEERAVSCRLIVVAPTALPLDSGPPAGLLPLMFSEPRAFDEHELRRLSPAAKYARALIGVWSDGTRLITWGVVQSGPRWLQAAHGGGAVEPPMPSCLVVRVVRPGHLAVSCGARLVAELRGGKLADFTLDVFQSQWLPARFRDERAEVATLHRAMTGGSVEDSVAAEHTKQLAQRMLKRVLATMRAAHHGGAIVLAPQECMAKRYVRTKYAFREGAPRARFRALALASLAALGEHVADLDEALFEMSHLIAALADVDGAVILSKRFEILGFGAEIAGDLPDVSVVRRALDLEAETFVTEVADGVGTRHRSAYRLCGALPGALAVVVSQDGGARFVTFHEGAVTYWDHGAGDDSSR